MKKTYILTQGKLYYEGLKKQGSEVELTSEQAEAINKSEGVTLELKSEVKAEAKKPNENV